MSKGGGRLSVAGRKGVLTYMRSVADADGIVQGVSAGTIARALQMGDTTIRNAIEFLIVSGEIEVVSPRSGQVAAAYRVAAPASLSIEAVTWHMPNRNYLGSTDALSTTPISLARVKFLEERT